MLAVPTEVFQNLNTKNLTKLDMSGNSLTVVNENAFLGLENLSQLKLNGNGIWEIEPGAFNGLEKLTVSITSIIIGSRLMLLT